MIYILDAAPTLTTKICPCLNPQNECDFIWQKGLRRCNEGKDLQVRSCWLREGLKSSNKCPYGRQERRKYTQTQMRRPREDGSRGWGDTAPRPGTPGTPRIRKSQELLREPSEGAGPCPHLRFRLLDSRTGRGYISEAFNLLVCGHLLRQPQDTHTRVVHHNLHFGCGARCVQVRGTEAYRIDLAG